MKRRNFCIAGLGTLATGALGRSHELTDRSVKDFRRQLHGEVLAPGDAAYDTARRPWNGAFDKRPALIARCGDESDVSHAITFSRQQGLLLAVRGGGHSLPGHSSCDGGLLLDLSRLRRVQVDRERRLLKAQGGALLADIDAAAVAQSLVMPAGTVSSTGIGGLALGGGFGRLARKWGLSCDQLVGADLVDARGKRLHASADENADLFWALRGGGGNFGVVTSFEFKLHDLPAQMQGGALVFAWKNPRQLLRAFADICAGASDDFFAMADIVPPPDGGRAVAIEVFHSGPHQVADRDLGALRKIGELLHDGVKSASYPALQSGIDKDYPAGRGYYLKSGYCDAMSGALIDAVVDHVDAHPPERRVAAFITLGGAVSRVDPKATAYWHRAATMGVVMVGVWNQPADAEASRRWVREGWQRIESFTDGFYTNLMAPDENARRLRASFGGNFDRLLALKRRYDPDNVFRLNANLRT
jgi:FAD/FMN-containing dehydrogenase